MRLLRGTWPSLAVFYLMVCSSVAVGQPSTLRTVTSAQITKFFQATSKAVLTFVGYSGAGYEDHAAMLEIAARVLDEFDPGKTIVNIGATPDGIGAVYELAKRRGFQTTGIVSTQAQQYNVGLSPYVDHVFYVEDTTWGGYLEGTERLSPTSHAMIENSNILVGIGGGEVARDELLAAQRSGTTIRFFPADMNHRSAQESARRKGLPPPKDFRGAAHLAF